MRSHRWFWPFVLLALGGCAHLQPLIQPPEVRVLSVEPVFVTLETIGLKARIRLVNRVPVSLPVKKIAYQVSANGKHVMAGVLESVETLGGSAAQVVEASFQIKYRELLLADRGRRQDSLHLGFEGKLYLGGEFAFAPVPLAFQTTIPVPRRPAVKFAGLVINGTSGRAGLELQVDNPNAYALSVGKVNLFIDVAGVRYAVAELSKPVSIAADSHVVLLLDIRGSDIKSVEPAPQMGLSGGITFQTPFGEWALPVGP